MKPIFKVTFGVVLGAVFGFAYYYFVGCHSGACPIASNPLISTLYGGVIGMLVTLSGRKDAKPSDKNGTRQP